MATSTVPVKIDSLGQPRISVKITNPKNKKTVTAMMLPDTGTNYSILDGKYARTLGLDEKDSRTKSEDGQFFYFPVQITIGSTKPVTDLVGFGSKGQSFNLNVALLGSITMLKFPQFIITRKSVTVSDAVMTVSSKQEKEAAMAEMTRSYFSNANYRNRI